MIDTNLVPGVIMRRVQGPNTAIYIDGGGDTATVTILNVEFVTNGLLPKTQAMINGEREEHRTRGEFWREDMTMLRNEPAPSAIDLQLSGALLSRAAIAVVIMTAASLLPLRRK